ncbi:uncharacterized protein BX664DRAFT_253814 [Halteromyces radiatus]|uniref:uncharacterized protein n=1 Tax=Halteromyces radiatus TaxID=101107 RepID=UPI00221F6932|nr:uncharacterized protein BX664DRAFT_253814 [Halteromyces radiatus]KAI8099163.1 hypothetical protein BX664DRAFT_253814 [Halteromyces radiatus]
MDNYHHDIQRPNYFNLNVYSRPNGKGIVQHIYPINPQEIIDDDNEGTTWSSHCFNLQSKHIGSIDVNDPMIKLTFYRSKDCLGAPIRTMKPTCTHSTKVMMKAKSVSIKRLKTYFF